MVIVGTRHEQVDRPKYVQCLLIVVGCICLSKKDIIVLSKSCISAEYKSMKAKL